MADEATNVWIPEDLVEYYAQRAEADPNLTDLNHAVRVILRKHRMFEEGLLEDPLEDLKLEAITCCKCE